MKLENVLQMPVTRASAASEEASNAPDPSYSGLLYVDAEERVVLRITRESVDVPATSKVEEASTVLDYPLANVGVSRLLLPFKAEEQLRSGNLSTRTVVEVHEAPAHLTPIGKVTLASSK